MLVIRYVEKDVYFSIIKLITVFQESEKNVFLQTPCRLFLTLLEKYFCKKYFLAKYFHVFHLVSSILYIFIFYGLFVCFFFFVYL